MSDLSSLLSWMTPYLDVLPRSDDLIFTEVWQHNRFSFMNQPTVGDEMDLWSARLVCAAMHENKRLLLVLPDRAPHRPALLFASCLVMDALDAIIDPDVEPNKVVYFGTTIGIREQLGAVKVGDLALDHVFPAYQTLRSTTEEVVALKPKRGSRVQRQLSSLTNNLPQVICVYSPADPCKIIDQFEPTWLAVDCSDTGSIRWLPSLIEYAEHLDLPIVAWCQSPFAATVHDFLAGGLIFRWPKTQYVPSNPSIQQDRSEHCTSITSILIDTEDSKISAALQRAYTTLAEVARVAQTENRLLRDTLNVGWRYLQALELLPVPLALYEAEVQRFWNVTPLQQLRQTFLRFIEAINSAYPQAAHSLRSVYDALDFIQSTFINSEPPIWAMLSKLCLSTAQSKTPRVIVFSSEYRRQLFSFALLSRCNITENELQTRGIWLTTHKAWHREYANNEYMRLSNNGARTLEGARLPFENPYLPIVVGLPNARQAVMVEPLLDQAAGHILLYPYQQSALLRRIQEWNAAVAPQPDEQALLLADLSGETLALQSVSPVKARLKMVGVEANQVKLQSIPTPQPTSPWQSLDTAQELARLFEYDEDDELSEIATETREHLAEISSQAKNSWTDIAIVLQLEGGWQATFSDDDTVQIIVGSSDIHIEERYIRSIRQYDRILFIIGQRRQNLYDLIVARVHAHPAIELHLAMIRRWHEELPKAYGIWKNQHGGNLELLLIALQKQGSLLTSTQTLRLWLNGAVLCPENEDDLRRMGQILNIAFVRANYRAIDKAAQRLRNIHRALARRLNRWLQQEATSALREGKPDTFMLDKELGLTFSDFRDSLLILRIDSIRRCQGLFLRSNFGQLEREVL